MRVAAAPRGLCPRLVAVEIVVSAAESVGFFFRSELVFYGGRRWSSGGAVMLTCSVLDEFVVFEEGGKGRARRRLNRWRRAGKGCWKRRSRFMGFI